LPFSCGQQPGQSGEVRRHRQDESGSDALDAAIDGLGHAADGLGPAERLIDPLAVLLGQRVARVAGGAAVDGGVLQAVQLLRHAANRTRARAMRGTDEATRWLFSHVDLEEWTCLEKVPGS